MNITLMNGKVKILDTKKIEMIIETFTHCQKEQSLKHCTCECKNYNRCYTDIPEIDLIEIIVELYKKVKVNPDWGNDSGL